MTEQTGGTFRNSKHYLVAALAGGAFSAVISMVPVIGMLNLVFFFWVVVGGALSAYIVQRKTQSVEITEGAAIGALSGLTAGLMFLLLGTCVGGIFGGVVISEGSNRDAEEFLTAMAMLFGFSCFSSFTIYPFFAAIGGALAAMIWKPNPAALPGAQPGATPAPPSPEDLARRKRNIRIALGGCGGCLALMLAMCGGSGYLFYLEEGVSIDDTAGSDEIVSAPFVNGQIVQLTVPGTGGSTGRYGFWLVGEDDLPAGLRVTGESACDDGYLGEDRMRPLYTYNLPEGEWQFIDSEYAWSGRPMACRFQVTTSPVVTNARIVVTRHVKPSDWFD